MKHSRKFITLLDWYIIRKFLSTFFFSLMLILAICVVFDVAEKIDDFIMGGATLREIVFDYYINFIPYFGNLFSSLFVFISVIFFTTKLASNSEIIAMQSSGMSLQRLLRPYLLTAFVLFVGSYLMSSFVIPRSNAERLRFENTYVHGWDGGESRNIHRQVRPGLFVYLDTYTPSREEGTNLSVEYFEDGRLVSKLWANYITWDSVKEKWHLSRYYERHYKERDQEIVKGTDCDTMLYITPEDLWRWDHHVETMDYHQLNAFIAKQRLEGDITINSSYEEKYRRLATPFASLILTILGVCLSSRKRRGAMGQYLGLGLGLSFAYILFQRLSAMFTINGGMNPLIAVWIPNILYSFIALGIFLWARR